MLMRIEYHARMEPPASADTRRWFVRLAIRGPGQARGQTWHSRRLQTHCVYRAMAMSVGSPALSRLSLAAAAVAVQICSASCSTHAARG